MVFQCPCGTRPIRRSPRGQRPESRTILVLAAVSSIKTRWAGSNMPCSRIQRRRARATSARSCSAARRLFFDGDLVTLKEAPDRSAAAKYPVPAHCQNHFVQREIRLFLNQTQQKIRMLFQRRDTPTPRLGRAAAGLPKALHPDDRRAGANSKLLRRRPSRSPAFNLRNQSLTYIPGISPRHRPTLPKANQCRQTLLPCTLLESPRFEWDGTRSRSVNSCTPPREETRLHPVCSNIRPMSSSKSFQWRCCCTIFRT